MVHSAKARPGSMPRLQPVATSTSRRTASGSVAALREELAHQRR